MASKDHSLPPSITKIIALFALGVVLAILTLWLWRTKPFLSDEPEQSFTEVVLSGLPKLIERWQLGDQEGLFGGEKWKCSELPASPHVAQAYLSCNPHYLECWARGEAGIPAEIPVVLGDKTFHLRLSNSFPNSRHGKWVTRAELNVPHVPLSGLLVEVEVKEMPGKSWPMILDDSCRGSALPQRRYSYGPRPEKRERPHEMDWDTDGRNIIIDKFLVSRSDVNTWWQATAKPAPLPETNAKLWALPAIGLTETERSEFCAWHGKKVMEAHLWDAATMNPPNIDRPFPEFVVKSWLPWTRDRRGTFFEEAALNPDWEPRAIDCALAYVKECQGKFPYLPHETDNVSWMGIYQVLGGTPEYLRNPVEPELELKASSQFLSAADPLHQLGRRIPAADTAMGFRCYREDYP